MKLKKSFKGNDFIQLNEYFKNNSSVYDCFLDPYYSWRNKTTRPKLS